MPLPSAMPISQHQLAATVLAAAHIVDRRTIAAFVADAATQPAPNPFPNTSAGAVRQVWQQRVVEFQSFGIQVAGLACLLTALANMSVDEPLVQEILRAGPHTTNVFSHGDGSRIVGAVLYGKPGFALAPALKDADFVLMPVRPSRLDIVAARPTLQALVGLGLRERLALVLNQCPPPPSPRASAYAAPLRALGVLAEPGIIHRVDHQDALATGLGVTEFAPGSQAAEEVRVLWAWIDGKRPGAAQ